MEEKEVVLKVENLEKSFKVGNQLIPVIKGMSFEVYKGDFTVIIGASGSGKSTLLHMLLGLETPSSGEVTCLGVSLYQLPNEDARSSFRKKHIGMVYQQPNWVKSLNVIENVSFPLSLLGVDKGEAIKQAWHVILKMNMSNWVNYYPTELSGGQQQKIALSRALVIDPGIIIADEPTGNLDFESGKALMQLLQELNAQGKTIIMVTHDLEYIKYAKSVIKIFDGKVESIVNRAAATSEDELLKADAKIGLGADYIGKRNARFVDLAENSVTAESVPASPDKIVNSSENVVPKMADAKEVMIENEDKEDKEVTLEKESTEKPIREKKSIRTHVPTKVKSSVTIDKKNPTKNLKKKFIKKKSK